MESKECCRMIVPVVLVACGLTVVARTSCAEPPRRSAIVGKSLTAEERARIRSSPDNDLVSIVKTGGIDARGVAIGALMARDKGDLLLAIAKAGPRQVSDEVIEGYVPIAATDANSAAKERVDAYIAWLEEQLKAESPVVSPHVAVRGLGRVAVLPSCGMRNLPTEPRMPAPYQYQRVVSDLCGLLNDKRLLVRTEAVHRLGPVGGYTEKGTELAKSALTAYRKVVAAQAPDDAKGRERQQVYLGEIDAAIKFVLVQRATRIRFGVEGETKPVR